MSKHNTTLLFASSVVLAVFLGLLYDIRLTEKQLVASVPVPIQFPYKNVALTFDDGPYGNSTQAVMDILEKNNIHATFFIVGKNAEHYPSEVKQEVTDGNLIGNHSYDHAHLGHLPLVQMKNDVSQAEQTLVTVAGLHPRLFRAPYGDTTPAMIKELQHEGYVVAGWNVDPHDWDKSITSDMLVQYVVMHARQNSIVLLHDGRDTQINYSRANMLTALPRIIVALRQHGYRFVTADTILNEKPYY